MSLYCEGGEPPIDALLPLSILSEAMRQEAMRIAHAENGQVLEDDYRAALRRVAEGMLTMVGMDSWQGGRP